MFHVEQGQGTRDLEVPPGLRAPLAQSQWTRHAYGTGQEHPEPEAAAGCTNWLECATVSAIRHRIDSVSGRCTGAAGPPGAKPVRGPHRRSLPLSALLLGAASRPSWRARRLWCAASGGADRLRTGEEPRAFVRCTLGPLDAGLTRGGVRRSSIRPAPPTLHRNADAVMAQSAARHVIAARAVDHPVSESEGDRRSTWNLGKPLLWGRRALSRPCEHRRTTRVSTAGVAGFCVKPELRGPLCVDVPACGGGEAR